MDSIFGIGLPELFFIAILALIILGPERLPGTLREIAKAWGYIRNLGRELTEQFGDEFKALEDLNPRKILNEMADEELAKDLGLKKPGPAQKKPATTTPAKTTAAKTTPAKPTPAKTTTAKTTPAKTATAETATATETPAATSDAANPSEVAQRETNQPADEAAPTKQTGATAAAASPPALAPEETASDPAKVAEEPEHKILPPPTTEATTGPAQATPKQAPPTESKEKPKDAAANGDGEATALEKQPLVSTSAVNANGVVEPTESAE